MVSKVLLLNCIASSRKLFHEVRQQGISWISQVQCLVLIIYTLVGWTIPQHRVYSNVIQYARIMYTFWQLNNNIREAVLEVTGGLHVMENLFLRFRKSVTFSCLFYKKYVFHQPHQNTEERNVFTASSSSFPVFGSFIY